jgi:hypothetical protein
MRLPLHKRVRTRRSPAVFIQNTAKLFNVLPVLPAELEIVLLTLPASVANIPCYTCQFRREFKVWRNVVLTWRYLKRNYRDYNEIVIFDENLAKLPEAGEASDRVARIFDDSFQEPSEDAEKEDPTQSLTEVQRSRG